MHNDGGNSISRSAADRPLASAILLLLLVGVCYFNTLLCGFVWDDFSQVVENPYIRSFAYVPKIFSSDLWITSAAESTSGFYRPLQNLSYLIDYQIAGLHPWMFHLTNVLLHAICCLLVLALARWTGLAPGAAFLAAAVFAAHPLHVEEVAFIGGRGGLLSAVFLLSSLFFLTRFCAASGRRSFVFFALAMAGYFLALLSKPLAILFPVVMAAIPWVARPDATRSNKLRSSLLILAAGILVNAAVFLITYLFAGTPAAPGLAGATFRRMLEFLPSMFSFYCWKLTSPMNLSVDYALPAPVMPLVLLAAWVVVLAGAFYVGVASLLKGQRGAIWLILFLAVTVPLVGLVGFYAPLADRYMYLPVACVGILIGPIASLPKQASRRALGVLAGMLIVFGFGVLTILRNGVFLNEEQFYADAMAKSGHRSRTIIGYAHFLASRGQANLAAAALSNALRNQPDDASIRLELAKYDYDLGKKNEAKRHLEFLLARNPHSRGALDFLAHTLFLEGRYAEAYRANEQALAREPSAKDALLRRALLLDLANKPDAALSILERLAAAYPFDGRIIAARGSVLLRLRRYAEAERSLRRALELNPRDEQAQRLLKQIPSRD